jgi:hypothetical protein
MPLSTEVEVLLFVLMVLSFLGLIQYLGAPQIISPFDFFWLAGGMVTVTGACVISTGIPCAGALAIFGIASFTKYLLWGDVYTMAIFVPLFVVLIYIILRLGRGGG